MEEWKDIEGYEGLYQISNEGKIKNSKGKILKCGKDKDDYLQVGLYKDGKRVWKKLHRLVAEAFIPNPNNYEQVNHKDEDKANNCLDNLEWCDSKYNNNYGTRNQRSAEKRSKRVDQIDKATGEVIRKWESTMECDRNGFNQGAVAACCNGLRKTHKGYIWKYPM
jgi:hypothetical protein